MKYTCLLSHEQPGDEPGKFKRYEAGAVYDLPGEPDGAYFAVYGGTEAKPKTATKARRHEEEQGGAGG